MRIVTLKQGYYGERIWQYIKKRAPQEWVIDVVNILGTLPPVVDEPEEFLPLNIPQADLLLALSESLGTAQLVPAIARLSGAKAVIVPVDNSAWLPTGLRNQIREEIVKLGVTTVFPKTFCTLTENNSGFGNDVEPYDNEYIASFATYFGEPRLNIVVDTETRIITEVEVERSAPCGSTYSVAEKLIGIPLEEAVPQAGLHAHHYPCLASMVLEPMGDTLMHVSGYVVNEQVEREIERLRRSF